MTPILLTLALLAGLIGCAQNRPAATQHTVAGHSQNESADHSLVLRREADALRDMASRREAEARILADDPRVDQDTIRRKRELVQRLLQAADEADQEAAAFGRQVPHGMVQ
jgi:hypothetical protein